MKLRREARIGIGAIMVLQFALSMMTIALLSRMGPAIERILQENVRTEEAVEQMLAELSHAHTARAVPQVHLPVPRVEGSMVGALPAEVE